MHIHRPTPHNVCRPPAMVPNLCVSCVQGFSDNWGHHFPYHRSCYRIHVYMARSGTVTSANVITEIIKFERFVSDRLHRMMAQPQYLVCSLLFSLHLHPNNEHRLSTDMQSVLSPRRMTSLLSRPSIRWTARFNAASSDCSRRHATHSVLCQNYTRQVAPIFISMQR